MMIESGFSIELDKCLCCHHVVGDETMYFVPSMGGIICADCASSVHYNKNNSLTN